MAYKQSVWQETIFKLIQLGKLLNFKKILRYITENIDVNFENFDDITHETKNKLIDACEYDDNEKENDDVHNSGNYDIVGIECESVNGWFYQ